MTKKFIAYDKKTETLYSPDYIDDEGNIYDYMTYEPPSERDMKENVLIGVGDIIEDPQTKTIWKVIFEGGRFDIRLVDNRCYCDSDKSIEIDHLSDKLKKYYNS
jgi:hypothetical protein